ncbi:hypothetical protein BD626DRAFT_636376 [Schizophyllum amplum]|uniref:Uncharacterized protein n=1 Tax=Schizophyllum amplum TaxID=97359 RepID=A0A550BTD6_9AGAR|nr:hypothetical protein BD626DRAFT_636376 [Auriculariopsis ampla]
MTSPSSQRPVHNDLTSSKKTATSALLTDYLALRPGLASTFSLGCLSVLGAPGIVLPVRVIQPERLRKVAFGSTICLPVVGVPRPTVLYLAVDLRHLLHAYGRVASRHVARRSSSPVASRRASLACALPPPVRSMPRLKLAPSRFGANFKLVLSDRRHLTRMSICIGPCRLPFPMPPNSHMRPLLTRTLPIRASTTPLISARRKARYALQDPYAPPSSPSCHCLSPSHTSSSSSTFSTCRVADLALHRGAAAREALLYAPSRPCRPTHHSRFVLHHLDRLLDLAAPRLSLSLRVQNCGLVPASYSPCDVLERGGLTTKGVAALHYSARLRCPLAVAPMSLIA